MYSELELTNFLTKAEFFFTDPSSLLRVSSPGRSAQRSEDEVSETINTVVGQLRSVTCNMEVLLLKLLFCTSFGQCLLANFLSLFLQDLRQCLLPRLKYTVVYCDSLYTPVLPSFVSTPVHPLPPPPPLPDPAEPKQLDL